MIISEKAILSGSGTLTSSLSGAGTISPGQGIGTLTIQNASPQKLHFEIDGVQADHLVSTGILDLSNTTLSWSAQNLTEVIYPIITYNSLIDGFRNTNNPPPGYLFDYNYQGNKIALIRAEDAYQVWSEQTHALSGGNALFEADPDLDGIPNGLEFFSGSNPAKFTKTHPLKASRISSSTSVSYPISSLGQATLFRLQSSTDLINWDDSFPEVNYLPLEKKNTTMVQALVNPPKISFFHLTRPVSSASFINLKACAPFSFHCPSDPFLCPCSILTQSRR